MKKIITATVLSIAIFLCHSNIVLAENPQKDTIYTEVNAFVADHKEYSTFFEDVLQDIDESVISEDNYSIIHYLTSVLDSAKEAVEKEEQLLKTVEEHMSSLREFNSYSSLNLDNPSPDTYQELVNYYRIGISIVNACNCPNTARYMEHAIVPQGSTTNPSNIYETNTAWARTLVYGCDELMWEIERKFEEDILPYGVSNSCSGGFQYTASNCCLDALTAFHGVNYVVTFVRRADGNGYNMSCFIYDVYDFDWSDYDNFAITFANNYCRAMQVAGYIRPYNIYITVS